MLRGYKIAETLGIIFESTTITVESVGFGEYCGFSIKGDNKRFLLSDFTVTHNCEIIKANNNLVDTFEPDAEKKPGRRKKEPTEQDRVKARASLRFRILTMFNNSAGRAKHTTNGIKICHSYVARRS